MRAITSLVPFTTNRARPVDSRPTNPPARGCRGGLVVSLGPVFRSRFCRHGAMALCMTEVGKNRNRSDGSDGGRGITPW